MAEKKVVSRSEFVDPNKLDKKADAGTHRTYQGTVEAEWQCNSCGHTAIPGSVKICPACQHPKDASESYHAPAQNTPFLTESELKKRGIDPQQHLSDESCQFCGAKLKPGTAICPNCRAVVGDVGYTQRVCPACGRETNEPNCPSCQMATILKTAAIPPSKAAAPTPLPQWLQKLISNQFQFAGIVASLLIFCCLGVGLALRSIGEGGQAGRFGAMPAKSERLTVTQIEWERTVEIEEYQYNTYSDWTVPADADLLSEEQQIHHYNSVLVGYQQSCSWQWQQIGTTEQCGYEDSCSSISIYDHTETICYDDGSCDYEDVYRSEQQCTQNYVCNSVPEYGNVQLCQDVPQYEEQPVYQTWYTYSLWEWALIQPAQATGNDLNLVWPQFVLAENQREKANGKTEHCAVYFSNGLPYSLPCDQLALYSVGSLWDVQDNGRAITQVTRTKEGR